MPGQGQFSESDAEQAPIAAAPSTGGQFSATDIDAHPPSYYQPDSTGYSQRDQDEIEGLWRQAHPIQAGMLDQFMGSHGIAPAELSLGNAIGEGVGAVRGALKAAPGEAATLLGKFNLLHPFKSIGDAVDAIEGLVQGAAKGGSDAIAAQNVGKVGNPAWRTLSETGAPIQRPIGEGSVAPAPSLPSGRVPGNMAPPRAGTLLDKIKAVAPDTAVPAGGDPEPIDTPEGKQPIVTPSAQGAPQPSSAFTSKQYEEAARIDKSAKLAKSLNASGVNPETLAYIVENASPAQKAPLWQQAAKEASDFHGEPVLPPHSPETEEKTLFYLRKYANGMTDSGPSEPLSYGATQDPATASTLTQGARRKMPDGSTQILQSVPISKISGDPGNVIHEPTVQKYQASPSTLQPELRAGGDGGYTIQEGHHRILAQVRNGANNVLAWTPEANLGPAKPGVITIKPSPELMRRLAANGGRGGQAAADLANALNP